jgi:hypothetical protein
MQVLHLHYLHYTSFLADWFTGTILFVAAIDQFQLIHPNTCVIEVMEMLLECAILFTFSVWLPTLRTLVSRWLSWACVLDNWVRRVSLFNIRTTLYLFKAFQRSVRLKLVLRAPWAAVVLLPKDWPQKCRRLCLKCLLIIIPDIRIFMLFIIRYWNAEFLYQGTALRVKSCWRQALWPLVLEATSAILLLRLHDLFLVWRLVLREMLTKMILPHLVKWVRQPLLVIHQHLWIIPIVQILL